MAQRLLAARALALQLVGERLAVAERVQSLLRRLLAIGGRGAPVPRGELAIGGGLGAALRRAAAPGSPANDRLAVAARAGLVMLLKGGVELGHRDAAGGRLVVAALRGPITAVGDVVAPVGDLQARLRCPVALVGGLLALARRPFPLVLGELVRAPVDAVAEVVIAGGLIAVGGELIAVGARLVAVGARLIGVRQRLVAVAECLVALRDRFVVGDRDGDRGRLDAALLSFDLPVARGHRTVA